MIFILIFEKFLAKQSKNNQQLMESLREKSY